MATAIATEPAARKRKGTETGDTGTKRRDDTSPLAGKWSTQTLLKWRKAVTYKEQEKSDLVFAAGKCGVRVVNLEKWGISWIAVDTVVLGSRWQRL